MNPHTCSCGICQKHTGSLTAMWFEFSANDVKWMGEGGEPAKFRSSDDSSRAFCPCCGSSVGAIDEMATIALLAGGFDDLHDPALSPEYHSFVEMAPSWWRSLSDDFQRGDESEQAMERQ
ncbi:GFA family protein [Neisseriaceae bacterium TC5R-5]|nr:GFA family protein [Neisseriaceae bacterium TC5R-5]